MPTSPDWDFVVPGDAPSLNAAYKVVYVAGHPRIAKADNVETWQTGVSWLTKQARPSNWVAARRVRIFVRVWFSRAGRDADNLLKFLLDGIATGLGVNDNCFLVSVISNEVDKSFPRVEVTIGNEVPNES